MKELSYNTYSHSVSYSRASAFALQVVYKLRSRIVYRSIRLVIALHMYSRRVNWVWRSTRHMSRDESLQAVSCTGNDNQTQNNQKCAKKQKKH